MNVIFYDDWEHTRCLASRYSKNCLQGETYCLDGPWIVWSIIGYVAFTTRFWWSGSNKHFLQLECISCKLRQTSNYYLVCSSFVTVFVYVNSAVRRTSNERQILRRDYCAHVRRRYSICLWLALLCPSVHLLTLSDVSKIWKRKKSFNYIRRELNLCTGAWSSLCKTHPRYRRL